MNRNRENMFRLGTMQRMLTLFLLCTLALTACKPKYKTHVQDPRVTMAADAPQELDFTQLHNDILEQYSNDVDYSFIKNLDISGSNDDPKTITITLDCIENVSNEAIDFFMSMLLQDISNEATVQDDRYTSPDSTGFGSVYDTFALQILITKGEDVYEDETIDAGEGIPYTPGLTWDMIEMG